MRTLIAIVLLLAAASATTPIPSAVYPVMWAPNAWGSQMLSYSGQLNTGVYTVPLPPGLSSGTYNVTLLDFVIYDANLYKWCVPALLTIKGANNQAYAAGSWGTFYMGVEFSFNAGSPSTYDITDRLMQPCTHIHGAGQQKSLWHVPSGSTVQFNISVISLQTPPTLDALTEKWELALLLS